MADEDASDMGERRKNADPQGALAETIKATLVPIVGKITNQAFLFVLGLMLVIVLMAVFAPSFAKEAIPLVALMGILGMGAFVWVSRKQVDNSADIVSEIVVNKVRDDVEIFGIRSNVPLPAGSRFNVMTKVGDASGNARVGAVSIGPGLEPTPEEIELLRGFRSLTPSGQQKIRRQIAKAE
jgi:hypothetical protein